MSHSGLPQDVDPLLLDRLRHQVTRVRLLHAEHARLVQTDAPVGSVAERDLHDRSLTHGYNMASVQISAAIDHLLGVGLFLDAGAIPTFATMTLCRTALETALSARWVLEPEDVAERRARGYALLFADHEELRKFKEAIDAAGEDPTEAVLDEAHAFGLVATSDSGTRRLMTVAPQSVGLTKLYPPPAGCEWLYRYLSGFSHGKLWAISSTMQLDSAKDLTKDMVAVLAAVPDDHLAAAMETAVDAVAAALGRLGHLRAAQP